MVQPVAQEIQVLQVSKVLLDRQAQVDQLELLVLQVQRVLQVTQVQ